MSKTLEHNPPEARMILTWVCTGCRQSVPAFMLACPRCPLVRPPPKPEESLR